MALAAEPTENADATQPTEPMDRIEPAEPIDRIEPDEPMDRMDPDEPMLRTDPDEDRSGMPRMAPIVQGTPEARSCGPAAGRSARPLGCGLE